MSLPQYTLPELPYDYSALEPHISGQIMELHHDKHHAAYVKGANDVIEAIAEAREKDALAPSIIGLSKTLAFHLGGHTNHSIFWKNLSPEGGGKPNGELAEKINESFGSYEKFVAQFTAAANGLQGSGWAILAYDTIAGRLVIEQLTDQAGNTSIGIIPILMLDMWEHAFYLQYKNVKADYVKAFWNIINWSDVENRYKEATAGIFKV